MKSLPQTDHPCFPQPDDPASKVWRYMDLAKLVRLLADESLHLARLDLLGDPHEGSLPFPNHEANIEFWKSQGQPAFAQFQSRTNLALREVTYVSCWTLGNEESEAMWKLYCGERQGVAIQTTYEKLAAAVSQPGMFIGRISYIDFEHTPIPVGNMYYAPMHKRLAFQHESEVRIVNVLMDQATTYFGEVEYKKNPPIDTTLKVDVETLIDSIYIHPYAPEWFESSVRSVVRAIAPALEPKLKWSRIKSAPFY